jgi:hypothetical protein
MILLGCSVVFAIGFMVLLTYSYERSLYWKDSYPYAQSALVNALGFSALTCFAGAYIVLAYRIALTGTE